MEKEFDFCFDRIECNEKKDLYIKATFQKECGTSLVSMDFDNAGEGELHILQILAAIYLSCPEQSEVVLIDNPEAYLHPQFQRKLIWVLKKIQKEMRIQVILATHSQEMIEEAGKDEVIIIDENQQNQKVEAEKNAENKIRGEQLSFELQ